ICCLRFTRGVAAPMQDLLPAGGLRLFREGVEPSGSLQKVSGYISVLLLRPLPDASLIRLQEDSVRRHHGVRRAPRCLLCGLPSESPTGGGLTQHRAVATFRPLRLHRIYWSARYGFDQAGLAPAGLL